jgi:hypothetical protein
MSNFFSLKLILRIINFFREFVSITDNLQNDLYEVFD